MKKEEMTIRELYVTIGEVRVDARGDSEVASGERHAIYPFKVS